MPYHVYIVDPPTLLDDLLESSLRLFHNRCAIIQRVFHEHWLAALGERLDEERAARPDASPEDLEAGARAYLAPCRAAFRARQGVMLRDEEGTRRRRDRAIHAFVASRGPAQAA